jgi:hypothetical protein
MRLSDFYSFGLPAAMRFYTEDDGGGGGTGASDAGALDSFETPPDETTMERGRNQDRVEGEKPPDFSALGGKKPAAKADEGGEAPSGEEKPAGETPAKPATPKKETAKAGEPAKKEVEGKKPETKKPEAKEKPAEKKPEAAAKPEATKIMTDAEIDALQPRADAPKQVVENFKQMRTSMKTLAQTAREAQAAKEALAKEVETLKAATGKLPPEIEERIKRADHFEMLFDAQNNPEFKKEYDGKIEASTEAVYKMLEANGLKPDILKQIKDVAAANGGDIEKWPHWAALINKFTDPLAKQEAINAISNRRQAIRAKTERLNALAADRETYVKEMQVKDKAQKDAWAKELETAAMTIGSDFEPAIEKEIPEGATPEVKKAIEAHNARVVEVAKEFQTNVLAAYNRDPKFIAEMAFANVKAHHFEKELTDVRAELEKAKTRYTEAETKLAKIKSAGRLAHVESPATGAAKKTTTEEAGKIGGDGRDALQTFWANR